MPTSSTPCISGMYNLRRFSMLDLSVRIELGKLMPDLRNFNRTIPSSYDYLISKHEFLVVLFCVHIRVECPTI